MGAQNQGGFKGCYSNKLIKFLNPIADFVKMTGSMPTSRGAKDKLKFAFLWILVQSCTIVQL